MACRVQVEQHVARAAIEPERGLGLARQKRDVADAADVDDRTRCIRSEYGGMKISDRSVRLKAGRYVVQVGKRKWARVTVR